MRIIKAGLRVVRRLASQARVPYEVVLFVAAFVFIPWLLLLASAEYWRLVLRTVCGVVA